MSDKAAESAQKYFSYNALYCFLEVTIGNTGDDNNGILHNRNNI